MLDQLHEILERVVSTHDRAGEHSLRAADFSNVDQATGFEIHVSVFYLIPTFLMTWYIGQESGLILWNDRFDRLDGSGVSVGIPIQSLRNRHLEHPCTRPVFSYSWWF